MPQFIMTDNNVPAFLALDEFTRGYIEALFFTETEPGTTREDHNPERDSALPGDVGFADIAPTTLQLIIADCAEFQAAKSLLLNKAYERDYSPMQAGRDFWFTRNGHGVGYWDRKELEGPDTLHALLTDAAKERGQRDAYFGDDGLVYL